MVKSSFPQVQINGGSEGDCALIKGILTYHGATNAQAIADWLYKIATDETLTEQTMTPKGVLVEKRISITARVLAAKIWKEMCIDKAVADVKQIADKGEKPLDLRAILERLSDDIETKKMKAGAITVKPIVPPQIQKVLSKKSPPPSAGGKDVSL
jgi:hypothetical protein